MKKIDAHAHIGHIGGWANVGITEEGLIRQMDEFDIEKTALCCDSSTLLALADPRTMRVMAMREMAGEMMSMVTSQFRPGMRRMPIRI